MNVVNPILTSISGVVIAPVRQWPPLLVLVVLSLIAGALMTVVFRYTSNQKALRRVAARTKAQLLCMRLFKDDMRVGLRAQGELITSIGLRLWYSLPPMLVLIVPFVLILTQLSLFYEKRPLQPGEQVVAAIELDPEAWDRHQNLAIQVPYGVSVETPPMRDAAEHTVYWRLRLDEPPAGVLRWNVGTDVVEKSLVGAASGRTLQAVSARRPGPGFWDRLLYPGESGFAAGGPVRAIEVRYPARQTPILGIDVAWWLSFFALSMVAALIVRPFLKVQF